MSDHPMTSQARISRKRDTHRNVVLDCAIAYAGAFRNNPAEPSLSTIAEKVSCSRNAVRAHLATAQRSGILRLVLALPPDNELSEHLKKTFGLADAIVLGPVRDWSDPVSVREVLAPQAVLYLVQRCEELAAEPNRRSIRIGVDGGMTLYKAVHEVACIMVPRIEYEISPLVFGPLVGTKYNASVVANILANKLNVDLASVTITDLYTVTREPRRSKRHDELGIAFRLNMPPVSQIGHLDVLLLGIGSKSAGLGRMELDYDSRRLHGDICNIGFNRCGEQVASGGDRHAVVLSLTDLQRLAQEPRVRVVGIAGGRDKVDAIRTVLECAYISVLITDRHTAEVLLYGSKE